ncbi:MAG: Gfo/Idh/MocA family oxidoreductase [Bryobacterales bacterium]|nr:Gfo/Idh/MocA family oxidoreductase [Bryobacterales bacterium]
MKRILALICLLAAPMAAAEYKIAVVSLLHAHVWLHLGTMMKGDPVKLVGVSETLPDLIARATREDVIPQTQNVRRPGVPQSMIFSDWKKMIDETKPDMVWAFTPTNEHVDVVRYCAPRGIHVIVEKPLAATYREALEIQALARKHKINVMTNYGSTWQASQYAIRAAIEAGEIGPVWRLHGVTGHNGPGDPRKSSFAAWLADPVQNGGGALMDFGCYQVLWTLSIKGKPRSVYATAQHMKPEMFPKVEDHAVIVLNYSDGVAILEASWDLPPAQRLGNEVYGMSGSIVGNSIRKAGSSGGGRGSQQPGAPVDVKPLPPERSEPIAYMVDRLRTKQPLDGQSALDLHVDVQEVLEAAKMSVKSGTAIALPLKK